MQLSILTSILQSRVPVRSAAQSRVLGQVQQQQQVNSARYNKVQLPAVCVYCTVDVAS